MICTAGDLGTHAVIRNDSSAGFHMVTYVVERPREASYMINLSVQIRDKRSSGMDSLSNFMPGQKFSSFNSIGNT